MFKHIAVGLCAALAWTSGASAQDCSKAGSEIERRNCMQKIIAADYARLDKKAEAMAKVAEASGEPNTPRLRKMLRDAQRSWKQYVDAHCGAKAVAGGGSAGVDEMLFCKIEQVNARDNQLGK